jgi:hypothetical protein
LADTKPIEQAIENRCRFSHPNPSDLTFKIVIKMALMHMNFC